MGIAQGSQSRGVGSGRLGRRARVGVAVCAALVGVAAASLPAAARTVRAEGSGSLDRYYGQRLSWQSCVRGPDDTAGQALAAAGGQCSAVRVPLDYGRPGGRTITVAIARIAATDSAHRIGTLVVNEGGPADPVIDYLSERRAALGDTGARFDLVGIDPRFTGRNAPLDCGWQTATYFRSAGADRAGFDRMTAFERGLAGQCAKSAGDLLPYASTRNAARDMDVVRGVLGERRISYLGVSYGTYLGEVYTAMFPGRTDRVVLDGVHEPSRLAPWPEYGTEQENDDALRSLAGWIAARDGTYGLGDTADAVLGGIAGIEAAAAKRPLEVGPYRLDEHLVPIVLLGMLGGDQEAVDPYLAVIVRTLKEAADTGRADPDPVTADYLASLGADGGYGSTQTAYLCADTPGPRDPEVFWRAIQRSRTAHPLFGPILNDVTPCAFWAPPRERPTVVGGDVPSLMVNATGDPRVPYSEALAMHAKWPSSRLITVEGSSRHGVYGTNYANSCVNGKVNAYLATGTLPAADISCPATRGPAAAVGATGGR